MSKSEVLPPVEAPSSAVSPESSENVSRKRLHISGLPQHITSADLSDRFGSFGRVHSVELIPHQFVPEACRGFAYVDLEASDATQLQRCFNTLNGASWKGGKLKIAAAKPGFWDAKREAAVTDDVEEGLKKRRPLRRHAANQALVTDKNVDERRGWRRGRYGRAIAIVKLRKPGSRQPTVIDPTHYKNNLEKLFGSVRPKPLHLLAWTIEDFNQGPVSEAHMENAIVPELLDDTLSQSDSVPPVLDEVASLHEPVQEDPIQDEPSITAEVPMDDVAKEGFSTIQEALLADPLLKDTVLNVDPVNVPTNDAQCEDQQQNYTLAESNPFKVNVSWSSLFGKKTTESSETTTAGGFSLARLAKVNDQQPSAALFAPQIKPAAEKRIPQQQQEQEQEIPKKTSNFSSLFADYSKGSLESFTFPRENTDAVKEKWAQGREERLHALKVQLWDAKKTAKRKNK